MAHLMLLPSLDQKAITHFVDVGQTTCKPKKKSLFSMLNRPEIRYLRTAYLRRRGKRRPQAPRPARDIEESSGTMVVSERTTPMNLPALFVLKS